MRRDHGRSPAHRLWLRYLAVSAAPFGLIWLWRSPWAAAHRPAVAFGSPWADIVLAWTPEGFVFGVVAYLALRTFGAPSELRPARFPIAVVLIFLVLWAPIWALGVIVPGGSILSGFAQSLGPLKDTFLAGGMMGGVLTGGVALVYALICGVAVLLELASATAWAGVATPMMTRVANEGRIALLAGGEFGAAALAGIGFWCARLLLLALVSEPTWRGALDAAATVLLIGAWASSVVRKREMRPPPPNAESSYPDTR